jgi:WD40 repeat protein
MSNSNKKINKNIHKGGKVKGHIRHFRIAILDNKEIHRSDKGIGSAKASISMKANPIDAAKKLLSSICKYQGLKKMKRLKCNAIFSIKETTRGHSKIYGPYKGKFVNLMKNGKEKIVKLKTGAVIKYSLKPVIKKYKEKNYKNLEMKVGKVMKGGDPIDLFNYKKFKLCDLRLYSSYITCVAIIEEYGEIALGKIDGRIEFLDINSRSISIDGASNGSIQAMDVYGEGKYLISGDVNGNCTIWNIKEKKIIKTFNAYDSIIYNLNVINNDKYIILNGRDLMRGGKCFFRKFDIYSGELIFEWENYSNHTLTKVIGNGQTIVSSGGTNTDIKVWDTVTGECIKTFSGHTNEVSSIAVNLERSQIISCSKDLNMMIWDLKSRNIKKNLIRTIILKKIGNVRDNVIYIYIINDGKKIILCRDSSIIEIFDIDLNNFEFITRIDLDPYNNKPLFAVNKNNDSILYVRNYKDSKPVHLGEISIYSIEKVIYSEYPVIFNIPLSFVALFNNNNNFILCGGNTDNKIRLFNKRTRISYTRTFYIDQNNKNNKNNKCHSNSIAISNDDNYFVSANSNNTITIFEKKMNEDWENSLDDSITLIGHSGPVISIAIINQRKYILSGSSDNKIKLWNLNKKEEHCINTFLGHTGSVNSIVVRLNGLSFISGSSDNTIKIWDLDKQESIKTLLGHTGPVMSVKLFNDRGKIISGSSDKTIRIWDSFTGDCIKTLFGHTNSVNTISVIFNGKIISSGSSDNTIKIWVGGKLVQTLDDEKDVKSIELSKDGVDLVSNNGWRRISAVDGIRLLDYIPNKIKEEKKEEEKAEKEAMEKYHPSKLHFLNRNNYANYVNSDNISFNVPTPKVETPKVDTPKVDTPKVDTPKGIVFPKNHKKGEIPTSIVINGMTLEKDKFVIYEDVIHKIFNLFPWKDEFAVLLKKNDKSVVWIYILNDKYSIGKPVSDKLNVRDLKDLNLSLFNTDMMDKNFYIEPPPKTYTYTDAPTAKSATSNTTTRVPIPYSPSGYGSSRNK